MKRLPLKGLLLLVPAIALVLALAGPALAKTSGGAHYAWQFNHSCKAGAVHKTFSYADYPGSREI